MGESIRKWLEDYILTEKEILGGKEVDIRIAALREMMRNYRDMSNEQFHEAMTVAHFSNYFGDALSRMFYSDYNMVVGSWKKYTFADQAPDFRNVSRFRMTEPGILNLRREKAEQKAAHISESEIYYGVEEYSRQFDVSWRTILNDDLGKIRETPARMARAASRFEDQFVSALYDNATLQAALVALGTPWSGTGRLTAANLAIGINAMIVRTDANGNRMNIKNIHLVIPSILQIQAGILMQSALMPGVATNDKNVLNDYIAGVHVDPYIATAGINVPWYLVADPAEIPTITVARLEGVPGPWVYKKKSDVEMISGSSPSPFTMGSFATGDIEYAVEDIIGGWNDATFTGVTDFRGLYYSSGTTP
ncbi:MAG: hypothetical protein WC373_14535 [Smithella sp.]|jgi:hypothetical protein